MGAAKLSLAAALFAMGLLCSYLLPDGRAEQPALLRLAAGGGLAAAKPTVRTVGPTKTAAEQPAERAPAIDDEGEPTPGLGGTAEFHPRAPDEWQGMLVDVGFTPMCEESARCGL